MQEVSLGKIIGIAVLILIALWQIWPSVQWYQLDREDRVAYLDGKTRELDAEYETLVADLGEATQEIYREYGEAEALVQIASSEKVLGIRSAMEENRERREHERNRLASLNRKAIPLGLDLQGGLHMVLSVETDELETAREKLDAVDGVMKTMRIRIDNLGVAEPVVQKQGENQILIEMPGIRDPEELLGLLGKTASLEFKLVHEESAVRITEILQKLDQEAQLEASRSGRFIDGDLIEFPADKDPYVLEEKVPRVRKMLLDDRGGMLPHVAQAVQFLTRDYQLAMGDKVEIVPGDANREPVYGRRLYLIDETARLTGKLLKEARVDLAREGLAGGSQVNIAFDREGTSAFRSVTEDHVDDRLAIVLDNVVYSAPVIQEPIRNGHARITGSFDKAEARDLALILKAGSLPATTRPIESRVVGAYLGNDSIRRGIRAAVWGAVLVVLIMLVYYMVCGVIADLALVLNMLFLLGSLALFRATLTLPGIGGLILFIGMAVDANVLIFERVREDLANRPYSALAKCIDVAYGHARRTIVDANLTTLIAALVLFEFGTGPVRGFAVTLSLGILISMFTAIVVSRVIVDLYTRYLVRNRKTEKFSVGKFRWLSGRNIPFLAGRRVSLGLSAFVIVVGLAAFWVGRDRVLGVDFSPGTVLRVGFRGDITTVQIREALKSAGVMSEAEVKQESAALGVAEDEAYKSRFAIRFKASGEGTEGAQTFQELGLAEALEEVAPGCDPDPLGEDSVDAKISVALQRQGFWALIWAALMIMAYVSWRFQFQFAVAAVLALFHDVLMSVAIFSILRYLGMQIEFNLPELAALLTIFGYSINDTIVVFDRVRENVPRARFRTPRLSVEDAVNASINETLPRTIMTSVTTIITVLMLLVLGGSVIFSFALLLLIGLISGTYSSIFIASPVLLLWEEWRVKKTGKSALENLRAPST